MYLRLGQVRLGAGEPAVGARGLGCNIRPLQGLETWVVIFPPQGLETRVVTSTPHRIENIG